MKVSNIDIDIKVNLAGLIITTIVVTVIVKLISTWFSFF